MDHYREYQCRACDYYFSHPIDRCPICSDQFFWLATPREHLSATEKQRYVTQMQHLGGTGVTEEFLTYRNRLWLPYNFWEVDPGGELLADLEFIEGIKLYQHKKSAQEDDTETQSDNVFDTNPALSTLPFLEEKAAQRAGDYRDSPTAPAMSAQQFLDQPAPQSAQAAYHAATPRENPQAWQSAPAVAQVPQPAPVLESQSAEIPPIQLRDWLPPVLIFVFFMLLSLSFLVMRYHKNTQSPILTTQIEASHVYPFLS